MHQRTEANYKSMKFSDTLISWKTENVSKNKNKLKSRSTDDLNKTTKALFVQSAMRNPEFDQTISEVSQRVKQYSNTKDKATMAEIENKIKNGEVEYEDLTTIETMSVNNYKYIFKECDPDSPSQNSVTTIVLIALLVVGLIFLRISYAYENNSTLLLFISIINVLANAYTFFNWPQQVSTIIEKWLPGNNIKPNISQKMLGKVEKKVWQLSGILLSIIVFLLAISYIWLNCFELAVDIVSIIALGVSILNDYIVQLIAIYHEKHIYYDI